MAKSTRRPAVERFWEKVGQPCDLSELDGFRDCWPWTGTPTKDGYGTFSDDEWRTVRVHRFAYELLVGTIPDGLQLDHLCRVRHCVNPAHLEPVTARVNTLRSPLIGRHRAVFETSKTHCPQGHPYDEANTRITPKGWRKCKTCKADNRRRMIARQRAEREL